MRILYVSPRQCLPATSGAKLRDYYLARALGREFEVSYVYTADPEQRPLQAADLPFCREVVPVPRDSRYTPGKIFRGFFGQTPLPVLNYSTPAMRRTVAEILASRPFDLIHLDSIHVSGCLEVLGAVSARPAVVCDWHNIESELMRRFASHAGSLPKRLYALKTARQMETIERRILSAGAGHLVCSEREREQLQSIAPGARIAVVENGVDASRLEGFRRGTRHRLVFVGTMNYHANVDAITGFAREVWPVLRRQYPGLRLTIVGANPADSVDRLGAEPGIEVTGTVPDVAPYYAEAAAAIVPLRVGGGTRLKILEAMAAAVPVVSSTLGAEGLAVTDGRDILIADDTDTWVRRLSDLIDRPALGDVLASAARSLVRSRYDWRVIGERLIATYSQWFEAAARV